MAGVSTSTLSNILRDLYLPAVTKQLQQQILLESLWSGNSAQYMKISWQRSSNGVLFVPFISTPFDRAITQVVDEYAFSRFILPTTIEVPVMDTTMEKIIREHFIPVLSQHNVELRRQAVVVEAGMLTKDGLPQAIQVEGFKMMCTRCGHVAKFQVPPLTMLRERTRESVESFLREVVDQHFRPWEKVTCASEGTLRTLVAEWLTTRLVTDGALFDHQLPALLREDGFEHWDPEFVLLIAEGLEFVDDLTQHAQGKMMLLPTAHPLAPR